jgi:C4-dicarboxylate transporter DctM subunit
MIVYVIMVGGGFLVEDLFKAGVGPGFVLGGLLMGYSILVARRTPAIRARTAQRPGFAEWMRNVRATFLDGFWALMLPVVILGGIYGGLFSATAAGVVSVAYAYIVEAFVHRDIRQRDLPKILVEASILMGSILIILAFAFAFNYFLSARKIPNAAAQWLGSLELGPVAFMLILNGLLLVVGCLMDIMSAIMILAPLIAPMATQVGIDPIHLGIVFIVNLEIGYLTPPIGLNLFVSCTLFKKPFGQVVRSVLPFTVVMLGGLLLITYVPTVSLGIGGLFDAEKPFYVPFPDAPTRAAAVAAPDKPPEEPAKTPDTPGAAFPPATPGKVQSLKELMRRAAEPEEDKDEKDEEPPAPTPDAGKAPATKKKVKSLKELMREAGEPDEE